MRRFIKKTKRDKNTKRAKVAIAAKTAKIAKTIKVAQTKPNIFIAPTDTIYGILAPAADRVAVRKVYSLKGRSPYKPSIILISKISELEIFGITEMPENVKNFLNSVWPGPVSVILPLPKNSLKKFQYLHLGKKTLAFRLPKPRKILSRLLAKHGPLIAPSANPEGLPPATTIAEAKKYFNKSKTDKRQIGGQKTKPATTNFKIKYFTANRRIIGRPSKIVAFDASGKIKILRK